MTEDIYMGFGSHAVLEPQDLGHDSDKQNVSDPVSRWRNLKLQLRYFSLRARPEDTKNCVNVKNLKENISCESLVEKFNLMNNENLFVIETNSCDSFHSCHSSMSNEDVSKRYRQHKNKTSEEEFHDQITMINAIFLNKKKTPKKNRCEMKNENLLNKTNISDVPVTDNKCNFKSDKSSGDRTSLHACVNCTCGSHQKHAENTGILQNGRKEHQEHSSIEATELSHEKLSANKPAFKPFKINRKTIYGAKKPLMSKIIGRKGNQTMLHKLQPLKRFELKFPKANTPADETSTSPEDELHKGVLLKVKQGVNEGYEIHYLEPIRQNDYSLAFCSENAPVNLNSDVIHGDEEINSKIKKCETVNGFDIFEDSFLKLCNNHQTRDSIIKPSEGFKKITVDSGIKGSRDGINGTLKHNSDLNIKPTHNRDSLLGKQSEERNFSILYESETKFSDLSLYETFGFLLENEGRLEKTDNKYLNPVTFKETTIEEKKVVEESNGSGIENVTEEKMETTAETLTVTKNTTTSLINMHSKRKRSVTRKSSLPVIEESPEPIQEIETLKSDLLDNDYCLVDTLGRTIHLFDYRGFPLTDGSGRPLRSAGGELLLRCDDNGIPIVDEETLIFDMLGLQPHEEGFQPCMSPEISGSNRLTMRDGRPLVLFDVEGKPLTSVSGTMLVDRYGRSLLKLRHCFV